MSTQIISNGAMGFMEVGYMPNLDFAMSAERLFGEKPGGPGITVPSVGQTLNIGGSFGGADGLPPEKRALYEHIMSTYRMPLPTTNEIPTKPNGRKISILQRWLRRNYQKTVGRFEMRKHDLALTAAAGRPEVAADALFTLGKIMWHHSMINGAGLFGEAEDAWIKGALIMTGRDPFETFGPETHAEVIVPALLDHGIIRKNHRRGMVEGDDYIVGWELGAGAKATIYKVFNSNRVVKAYEGGAWQNSTLSLELGNWGWTDCKLTPSRIEDQVAGLTAVAQMGLGAARVVGYGDDFIVREYVPGITLQNARHILGANRLREAEGLYQDFMRRVAGSPHVKHLDRNPVNFVYTKGKEVGDGRLTLIDF